MSNELRVGIMFLVGLALLVVVLAVLGHWGQSRNTYAFVVRYKQAQGLLSGGIVRVSGVELGRVQDVTLDPSNNQALVTVRINEGVTLHRNDTYLIGMNGLVGERYIEITPNTQNPGDIVRPGDEVLGSTTPDMNEILANANTLVSSLNTTATSLNAIIGDKGTQENFRQSVANLERTTANTVEFTGSLNEMARRNLGMVDVIMANFADVSGDIRHLSDTLVPRLANTSAISNLELAAANAADLTRRLDTMAQSIEGVVTDPQVMADLRGTLATVRQTAGDIRATVANVKAASANLPELSANLARASADIPAITHPFAQVAPETAENLRVLSARLRNASEQIDNLARRVGTLGGGLGGFSATPELRTTALTHGDRNSRTDVNLDVKAGSNLVRLGAADITHTPKLNLQFGNPINNRFWLRYGLIEGKPGVGGDYQINQNMRVTGELFNPERFRGNALFDYRLPRWPQWSATAGVYGIFDDPTFGLGLTYRPGTKAPAPSTSAQR